MEFLFALFNEEKRWDGMEPDEFRREVGAYMAIGLCIDPAIRRYLMARAELLRESSEA
jgi:hypothetical protein